ncbi:MAG: Hsp33 family molecular chaperone HslO [Mariprofundaceae bacterium]|nr:Hsp33 family molecular chaperone HslO [Mariprofundaceae bacterium]
MVAKPDPLEVSTPTGDSLIRFLLPGAQTRGAIIRGSHLRDEACRAHGLIDENKHGPGELFGQTLIASILMLSISKGGVRQVLQLDGSQGPITRILAETRSGAVRGYINWNEAASVHGRKSSPLGWLGSPVTVSTVRDPGMGEPYISSIQSDSKYLADMMLDYMRQSVQIRADVLLHHDTGMLIEAMPGCGEDEWFSAVEAMAAIPDAVLDDDPEEILKAFAPLGMRIVGRDNYRWHCGCDGASMARALAGMAVETVRELQDEEGMITVACQYCGATHSVKPDQT